MLSTKGTASSPAQKQWPFRCCRPDYSGMVTPTPAPCRLFPPVQNKRKVPARRKRAFPWISFMTCHPVCPLQKPSPKHCWTGTPSSTQIAPTSSASGSFCYGSPKSLTSHPKDRPHLKISKLLHHFSPNAERNMKLKFYFQSTSTPFINAC